LSLVTKDTNPKDAIGVKKVPMSTVPARVIMEVGLAMLEGACKYGRHNYRVAGVRASVYYDAMQRHVMDWWEGEDTDPDSGLSHITKAIACLTVLRDSMHQGNWVDDRPPKTPGGWVKELNNHAKRLLEKDPDNHQEAYTCLNTSPLTLKPQESTSDTEKTNPSLSQLVTNKDTQDAGDSPSIHYPAEWKFQMLSGGRYQITFPNTLSYTTMQNLIYEHLNLSASRRTGPLRRLFSRLTQFLRRRNTD
jgi:hypothetical protein